MQIRVLLLILEASENERVRSCSNTHLPFTASFPTHHPPVVPPVVFQPVLPAPCHGVTRGGAFPPEDLPLLRWQLRRPRREGIAAAGEAVAERGERRPQVGDGQHLHAPGSTVGWLVGN